MHLSSNAKRYEKHERAGSLLPTPIPSRKRLLGFTLVELVVVITILAILGAIGFLSIQGYSKSARDSTRISDLANLARSFEVAIAAGKTLPLPDAGMLTITASGTTIGYQGYAGANVLRTLSLGGKFQDPLDSKYYTYLTNAAQNRYQVFGLLEDYGQVTLGLPFVQTAYAGYETRYPTTRGTSLWVLLGTWTNANQPVQEYASFTGIDLTKTTTGSGYVMLFSNTDSTASVPTSGAGAYTGSLFTFAYNKRVDLVGDKSLASSDSSLIVYWDMETSVLTGSTTLLKDFSAYGHHGNCYHSAIVVNCWTVGQWPQFGNGNGRNGKAMVFDGANTKVRASINGNTPHLNATYVALFKANSLTDWQSVVWGHGNWNGRIVFLTWSTLWTLFDATTDASYSNFSDTGSFHTAVVTFSDTGEKRVYLNGSLVGTWAAWNPVTPAIGWNTIFLGVNPSSTNNIQFFNGIIDELRVYRRILSDSEIQSLYNAAK